MKRVISMVLCLVLVLSLAATAFAADITITGGASGSEYAAYKLLNATDGGSNKFAYTLNDKYTAILQTVTGKETQEDIIAYIAALDPDGVRSFADAVYNEIVEHNSIKEEEQPEGYTAIAADATTVSNTFEDVAQGYYLIAETKVGDSTDTFSLVMLDTAGNEDIEVNTKEDKPTVEKQVQEKNDSTGAISWGDSADHDVGDVISYQITGTVSNKYADYESYYYSFEDTMDAGLDMTNGSVKVTIGGVDVSSNFTITYTEHGFTATANLKELDSAREDVTITADTNIVVTYTATLNENAVSGTTGNKNEVILKYENNPYHEDDGDPDTPDKPEKPGETPKDINVVFTFDAIVNKVDKDGNALEGAGFTLKKYDHATSSWVAVGTELTGDTTFRFDGLDVGKYKLEETTVPAGYNKADDVEFEIVAIYDTNTDPDTLTGLQVKNSAGEVISKTEEITDAPFTATLSTGEVEANVVNQSGSELPSTGGMGTTLFYVLGSIMVLAAVVLLVTKKRMSCAD